MAKSLAEEMTKKAALNIWGSDIETLQKEFVKSAKALNLCDAQMLLTLLTIKSGKDYRTLTHEKTVKHLKV